MARPTLRSFVVALAAALLATPAVSAQASGPRYYTVAPGDTLWDIAQRFHVTASEIADRSHLTPPYALRRGMRLHLPSRAVVPATPAPSAARAAPPVVRTAAAPAPAPRAAPAPPSNHREGGGRWGRPARPGVVHLVRVHDGETVVVNLRRIGPITLRTMRAFFRSASGQTHPIDARLLRQLGVVSDHFGGRTIEVISAFRPRRRRQWTAHSKHNIGHAVDFRVHGVPNRVTRDFCRTFPATGCGYYPRSVFVHMDTRAESTAWVDWSRPGERPRYGAEGRPPPEHRPAAAASAHPADTPDPSVPPVGAEQEVDDVAEDSTHVRTAPVPTSNDHSDEGHDAPDTSPAPAPSAPAAPAPPSAP